MDDLSLTLVQRVKIKFVYLDHFSLFVCGGESRSFDEVITFLTDYRFRFFKETLRCKFLDQRFKCLESFSFIQIDVERLIYIQYRKIKTRRRSNKNNWFFVSFFYYIFFFDYWDYETINSDQSLLWIYIGLSIAYCCVIEALKRGLKLVVILLTLKTYILWQFFIEQNDWKSVNCNYKIVNRLYIWDCD